MNHVWVHVWPVVEIDEGGLTALGNKIRPLTDGAGIEEVLAQGRVAVAGGDAGPRRGALRCPARGGRGRPRSRSRRPSCSTPRRLRVQGACAPAGAAWSTPTSSRRC